MRTIVTMLSLLLFGTPVINAQDAGVEGHQRSVIDAAMAEIHALEVLDQELDRAYRAYEQIKNTKGTEVFRDLDVAFAEVQRQTIQPALLEVVRKHVAERAAQKMFTRMVAAGLTAYDIGHWAALDAVLIGRNLKYHWSYFTRLKPAATRHEEAVATLEDALRRHDQAVGSSRMVELRGVVRGRFEGSCAPVWSGPAVVRLVVTTTDRPRHIRTECRDGRWSAFVSPEDLPEDGYAYAVIEDGRNDVEATPVQRF